MIDVHKVGVALSLTSNHAGVFAALTRGLTGLDGRIAKLSQGFKGLGRSIEGAFAMFAGDKILHVFDNLLDKAADFSHAMVQIQKLGGSDRDVAAAKRAAINAAQSLKGIDAREALSIYGDMYSVVGSDKALALLQPLAKYDIVQANTTGDRAGAMQSGRDAVRAADLWGRLTDPITREADPERLKNFLDMLNKIAEVTHGKVTANTFYEMGKTGGPGFMGMTDHGMAAMAVLAQYMGGPRTGTAVMSTMQQFGGGVMFKRQAEELQRLDLLHADEWKSGKGGRVTLTPEARERFADKLKDPMDWVEHELIPKMVAKGITSPEKQVNEIFALFGRATSQREFADIVRNYPQMQQEIERMQGAPGVDKAYDMANAGDAKQNMQNVSAAFQDLMYAFTEPVTKDAINAMTWLTDKLKGLTEQLHKINPTVLKLVAEGMVAIGVALIAFGAIAVGAAVIAFVGIPVLIGAAIAGVVAALGLLVAFNWTAISNGISSFADSIAKLWNYIKGMFTGGSIGAPGADGSGVAPDGLSATPMAYHPDGGMPAQLGNGFKSSNNYTLGGVSTGSSVGGTGRSNAGALPNTPINGITGGQPSASANGALSDALRFAPNSSTAIPFLRRMGVQYDVGEWCGDFAAAVIKSAGGTPPSGYPGARNWLKFGTPDALPHVGDIAVRRNLGHVTFVSKVYPDGSVDLEGGNQGGHPVYHSASRGYFYRKPPDDVLNRTRPPTSRQLTFAEHSRSSD